MRVSRFSRARSRVRRISAGVNRLKTSSEDSGSCQNYSVLASHGSSWWGARGPNGSPVGIIGWNVALLRQSEDALFENELGVARAHVCCERLCPW